MIIFFLGLISLTKGYQCSQLNKDELQITTNQEEYITFGLDKLYLDKEVDSNYILINKSPDPYFLNMITQTQYNESEGHQYTLISQKLNKNSGYLDISNYFSVLKWGRQHYYIDYNSVMFETTPFIDKVQELNVYPNSTCYDLVEINLQFIVECHNDEGDYFIHVNQDEHSYIPVNNSIGLQRKLDQLDNYILRNMYYSLELYQLNNGALVFLNALDTDLLRQLTQDNLFDLLIVDFQFHTNFQVSILNNQSQFICLEYSFGTAQWILLEYTYIEKLINPFSYDYSPLFNQLVVISPDTIYLRLNQTWKNQLNQTIKSKDKVYLTQNYIILKKEQEKEDSLQIFNQNLEQIHNMTLLLYGFITSYKTLDSFLLFNVFYIEAYTMNKENSEILRIQSNKQINQTEQFQIQSLYDNCYIQCSQTVVDRTSKKIYLHLPLIDMFKQGIYLDDLQYKTFQQPFQGQNLKLEFNPHKDLNLTFSRIRPILIKNVQDPNYVIYRKNLPLQEFGEILLIEQKEDLMLIGYTCIQIEQTLSCSQQFNLTNFIKLNDSQTQLWWNVGQTFFFAIASGNTIQIYSNNQQKDKFILINEFEMESTIKKIQCNVNYLYLLVENKVEAILIINNNQFSPIFSIPADNIYVNRPSQTEFYIISQNKLLFFQTIERYIPKLLWFTQIDLEFTEVDIGLISIGQNKNKDYLMLLAKKNGKQIGYVYNNYYYSKKHPYIEKEINLNDYSEIKIAEGCVHNSKMMFLEALNNGKPVLLIYRLQESAINSLFLEISIPEKSQISYGSNYLFITDKNKINTSLYSLYTDDSYSINIQLSQDYYQIQHQEFLNLSGRVYNSDENQQIEKILVKLINRGTQLFGIKKQLNFTYDKDENRSHCFEIGQSWYNGQAFDIELQEPYGDIEYQKTLIKQTETIQSSESIMEFDLNTLVQLIQNKIILINKADFQTTQFSLDNKYTFNHILYIKDNLIYVGAKYNDEYLALVIECINNNCKLHEGSLTSSNQFLKAFLNETTFLIWDSSHVSVYNTSGQPQQIGDFKLIQTFNFTNFNAITLQFMIFENYYQIFMIDKKCQLSHHNFNVTDNQAQLYFQGIHNVLQFLNEKFYYNKEQSCTNMHFVDNYNFIVEFKSSLSYQISFTYECLKDHIKCWMSNFQVSSIYQQYGNLKLSIQSNFYINQNILSQAYEIENGLEVFFYEINIENKNLETKIAIAHLSIKSPLIQLKLFAYQHLGKLHLLVQQSKETGMQHYLLRKSIEVCSEKESVYQDVSFLLKNSYHTATATFKLNITKNVPPGPDPPGPDPPGPDPPGPDPPGPDPPGPNPPDPDNPEDDKGKKTLWIIIGIGAGVLGIGLIIYCCKKKKTHDSLI
ncbi:unnamed protein product [Paramecium sonneborni]|uniref:Transmembrane protein n=1 Tax=Paramecium sonneborni TaxID=65129 RepID=A0A8S1R187_9CILI|nr:unnamed protein product [Paramecium sonneborni]